MTEVDVAVDDGFGIITLAAPERRNALTVEMAVQLVAACEQLDGDKSVGAVVVRGSGGFLCAGAHRELLATAALDPAARDVFDGFTAVYRSFARVSEMTVPTVAAFRGGAVGAGVNLLLACSLRIFARDSLITPGFRQLGLHPGGGHLALLHRVGGYEATVALGVFGQQISGERAVQLGLGWAALDDDEVEPRAIELARAAGRDPELSRMIMQSLRHEVGPPAISLAAALDLERAAQIRTQRRSGE